MFWRACAAGQHPQLRLHRGEIVAIDRCWRGKMQTSITRPRVSTPFFQPAKQTCGRRALSIRAAALKLPSSISKVAPKGDLVLAKVAELEEKTTGGILLPTSAQRRPTSGDIVALGDGQVGTQQHAFQLKVGDTILYSKFGLGCTEIEVQGAEHILLREDDVIGVMPRSNATAAEIPELQPVGERILVKVQENAGVTVGGVILPDSAKERPLSGEVVRVGPGKRQEDGSRKAPRVVPGDRVVYFKYAGDNMETPSGEKYVVLREQDILCKA